MILPLLTAGAVLAFQHCSFKVFSMSAALLLGFLFPLMASAFAGAALFMAIPAAVIYKAINH